MEVAYEYLETRKSQSQCGSPEPGGGGDKFTFFTEGPHASAMQQVGRLSKAGDRMGIS